MSIDEEPRRASARIVMLMVCLMLAVNLIFVNLHPIVWLDEVGYSDPAVRFLTGRGFTSGYWYNQERHSFWAGNTPLHQLVLIPWLAVFGINAVAVRSLAYIEYFIAVVIMAATMSRMKILSANAVYLTVTLLCLGYGVSWSYRSGRPDSCCIVLVAILVDLVTRGRTLANSVAIIVTAMAIPIAGLQCVPFTIMLAGLGVALKPSLWRNSAYSIAGMGGGLVTLLGFYHWLGVSREFAEGVMPHMTTGRIGAKVQHLVNTAPSLICQDVSVVPLFVVLAVAGATSRGRGGSIRRTCFVVLGWSMIVPVVMALVGKYPVYYTWMVFLPSAVAAVWVVTQAWRLASPTTRIAMLTLLAASAAIGLPARLAIVWNDRASRDHTALLTWMRGRDLGPSNFAYVVPRFYYGVIESGAEVIGPPYLHSIRQSERERVDRLYITPNMVEVLEEFPPVDRWRQTGSFFVGPVARPSGTQGYDMIEFSR